MATTLQRSTFPLEFHVAAIPLSSQAKAASRGRWKLLVADTARARAVATVAEIWLEDRPVAVTIYYFPTAAMVGDIDNIVKPILDALVGTGERICAQKFEPETDRSFAEPSEQLAAALDAIGRAQEPTPIVYIRVDNDLDWRKL